jgi:UDP-glucose 4-epimerase
MPLPFGAVYNRRAFAAADNVASFVAFRLGSPATGFEPFIVADDEQVSTTEFCRAIATVLGRRAYLVPVPAAVLRLALRAVAASSLAESTLGSLEVETDKARAAGWKPAVSQSEGLYRALMGE